MDVDSRVVGSTGGGGCCITIFEISWGKEAF